jgi:hypothetical protein
MKTCGKCPWATSEMIAQWGIDWSFPDKAGPYVDCPIYEESRKAWSKECSYRRIVRILRDEVRRLRKLVATAEDDAFENFVGWKYKDAK